MRTRTRAALCTAALLLATPLAGHAAQAQTQPQTQQQSAAPACRPSTASPTASQTGRNDPPPVSPSYFPSDFPQIPDSDTSGMLGNLGGFGGIRSHAPLHHTPVIFVHGNQADAQNWLDVMTQFQQQAGYTMQEMYALSFNGLGNYYAGAPLQLPPTTLDQAYINQNQQALANGGHGAADDDNVPDLCRFVEAVQRYTGSTQVDIVAHSLGVTLTRRLMELYPALAQDVVAFVGIAGANHGTTVCRGLDTNYYGCDEIAPGTQWLAALNAHGETYPPTQWMTVYDGAEGDPFFVGPDEPSPQLAGADNRTFNAAGLHGDYHNDLPVDPPEVGTYLAFLLRHGQAGPGAATATAAQAQRIDSAAQQAESSNQQAPSVYTLADAPLCIPRLTGTEDGCALQGTPIASGTQAGTTPPNTTRTDNDTTARAATLPNSAAGSGDAGRASLAVLAPLIALAAARRRRQRIPVSYSSCTRVN